MLVLTWHVYGACPWGTKVGRLQVRTKGIATWQEMDGNAPLRGAATASESYRTIKPSQGDVPAHPRGKLSSYLSQLLKSKRTRD